MNAQHLIDTPYNEVICEYLVKNYPKALRVTKASELLNILTDIFLGNKDVRYGPTPPPEHLVVIRKVIADAMQKDTPIPVLVPWGGIKGNFTSTLDVAEMSGLRQLTNLNTEVKKFFSPGIVSVIRIEDTGAEWLMRDMDNISGTIEGYSNQFSKLARILDIEHETLVPCRESSLMSRKEYFTRSEELSLLLEEYITATDVTGELGKGNAYHELAKLGWKGLIPMEQREFYRERYRRLYPGLAEEDYTQRLADYLGGAKARIDLGGRGRDGEFIQINFLQPIPGAPVTMFNNTLYYRTVSASESRTHIPAWRAAGYLSIAKDNSVKTKIAGFHDREVLSQLVDGKVRVGEKDQFVEVSTNYLVEA